MLPFLAIIFLGFLLGVRHATDPDHVIAVATIVSRERRVWSSAVIGILWGIGHTLTIVLVGGALILFSAVIPPRVGLTMELAVAVMLILLGVLNLTGIMRWMTETFAHIHRRPHGHGPEAHAHGQDEPPEGWLDRKFGRLGVSQVLRPPIVGVVHGLAGSAGVALLVLTTIRSPLWAIGYLLVFGVGTIVGMMLITLALALPFAYTARRLPRINQSLGVAAGVLSLVFGLFLVYQIGFVDGLFTGQPRGEPRGRCSRSIQSPEGFSGPHS